VTAKEAIALACRAASERGWPWVEPTWACLGRRGLLGLGGRYWDVVSNARSNQDYVRVRVDDRTGRALRADYVPAGTPQEPPITAFRAIEIAREHAVCQGWRWDEPAAATLVGPTRTAGGHWWVRAPGNVIGYSVSIIIDAATGEILQAGITPR
jgi:hypothetical protein